MIGKHNPAEPAGVDLKAALSAMLDEMLTGLEESFHDLSEDQAWRRTFPGKHAVGTMVMHLLETLDAYTCRFQSGRNCLEHQERFDIWRLPDGSKPEAGADLPSVKRMADSIRKLRRHAVAALESAAEDDLRGPRHCEGWWLERGRTAADAYLRAIGHATAHVRQIWLTRGAMGLTPGQGWPEQHLA